MSIPPTISLRKQIELFVIEDNRPSPQTARITCRVCGAKAEVTITWPGLLCEGCAEDLEKTAQHVKAVVEGFHNQVSDAYEKLDADLAHADEGLLGKWNAFQDEVTNGDPLGRVKKAEEVARNNGQGPFATLIRSWLNYKDAIDRLTEREQWASRAKAEIEAWGIS